MNRLTAQASSFIGALALTPLFSSAAPLASTPRHAAQPIATPDKAGARPFSFPPLPSAFVTLRPTTTADLFDAADLVAPGTGRLSLREAFALANQLGVEAAIVLERGAVYRLERCGALDGPSNATNELVHTVNKTLTVNGNAATIFQDCDGAGVIVQQGGKELLNLVDLTISGGRSRHIPAGAVWNSGTGELRITNAVIVDNQVISGGSAAAPAASGSMAAGGVLSQGDVIVSGATFARNRSDTGVGAIAALGAVKAIKSSFYDNIGRIAGAISAGDEVAPISAAGPPPFTGRTPNGVTLVYSTLSANSQPAITLTGGGLTSFASLIVGSGAGTLCDSPRVKTDSLGSNYSSGGDGCGFGSGAGDRAGAPDPKLQSVTGMKLVNVFAPAPGSPLLDAIPKAACVPPAVRELVPVYSGAGSDQLGVPRPQGSGCDIGAIEAIHAGSLTREVADPPPSDLPMPTRWAPAALDSGVQPGMIRVDTDRDSLGTGRVSLRDAIAAANRADRDTTIVLEPHTVYRLTRCVAPQSALDNDTNDLIYAGTRAVRVEGNGAAIVQTCDGSGVIAIFSDSPFILSGVTVSGGRSVIHPGGGIYMAGSGELRLERSWITDNTTVAAGGGIASFGNVILLDSTVSNNHSAEVGGGIIATQDVSATNSSLFDNTADLAIGAIGNHSGKLALLFTTIAHNTAPNVAVGSISSFGSIIADYLPPRMPPGALPGQPVPGGVHDGPPPGSGNGALKPGETTKPPTPGPGGFPPPANCGVERPGNILEGNYATDQSCGFASVGADPRLVPNRKIAPLYLLPSRDSPVTHLISASSCSPYRGTLDQAGALRRGTDGCASGAVEPAASSIPR